MLYVVGIATIVVGGALSMACATETNVEPAPAPPSATQEPLPAEPLPAEPLPAEPPPTEETDAPTGKEPAPVEDKTNRKRVFVSSYTYAGGGLGGSAGADAKCQESADAAKLGGKFRSGVVFGSGVATPLKDVGPYYLVDRETLVSPTKQLVPNIVHPIDRTENGKQVVPGTRVWTGAHQNCMNWKTTNPYAIGTYGIATSLKEIGVAGEMACDQRASMYCFEQ
jgi:hypothetical protein